MTRVSPKYGLRSQRNEGNSAIRAASLTFGKVKRGTHGEKAGRNINVESDTECGSDEPGMHANGIYLTGGHMAKRKFTFRPPHRNEWLWASAPWSNAIVEKVIGEREIETRSVS